MGRYHPERIFGRVLDDHEATRTNTANATSGMYHAKVIDNVDPKYARRIKVRIEGMDDGVPDVDLPWCNTLSPSFFYYIPQPGEYVVVALMNSWNKHASRMYFGPFQVGDVSGQTYRDYMLAMGLPTFEEGSK